MRESRTYGSVRGARGNSRPYRVPQLWPRALLHQLRSPIGTSLQKRAQHYVWSWQKLTFI